MLLPLAWLAVRVDLAGVARQVAALRADSLLAAWGAYLLSLLPSAVRWRLLLRAYGATGRPRLGALWRLNVQSAWFNLLPSGLVGDVLRGHRLRDTAPDPAVSYVVAFGERLVGLVGLAGLAVAAMALDGGPRRVALPAAVDFALAGVFLLPLAGLAVLQMARGVRARLPRGRLGSLVARFLDARALPAVGAALLISVLVQVLVIAAVWVLAARLLPAATPLACARIVPPVLLANFLPLTPAGFGQREATFVFFFAAIGMDADKAVALSLGWFAVGLATALLGGLFLLAESALARRGGAAAGAEGPP